MKLADGMVLTQLDDSFVAVSSGETKGFHGVVRLNKTGAAIWKLLEEGFDEPQIAQKLVEKYDGVDYDQALDNTRSVVGVLRQNGIVTD